MHKALLNFGSRAILGSTEAPVQSAQAFNSTVGRNPFGRPSSPEHVGRKRIMQLPKLLRESRSRAYYRTFAGFLATVVIGFGWGGWMLGSAARKWRIKARVARL
jgi:hypothetical protein